MRDRLVDLDLDLARLARLELRDANGQHSVLMTRVGPLEIDVFRNTQGALEGGVPARTLDLGGLRLDDQGSVARLDLQISGRDARDPRTKIQRQNL